MAYEGLMVSVSGVRGRVGEALTPDGTARWRRTGESALSANALSDARALGQTLGREIREEAGDAFVMGDA